MNIRSLSGALAGLLVFAGSLKAFGFAALATNGVIQISTANYRLEIIQRSFRYRFAHPDGAVIAPENAICGLEFGGGKAMDTAVEAVGTQTILLAVTNDRGEHARVELEPGEHQVRFAITQERPSRLVAHVGGLAPVFGLADHAALGSSRQDTEVTGFRSDQFRAQEPPGDKRLISNFIISPRRGFGMVNMERGVKVVHVLADDVAQGDASASRLTALYYFIGTPPEIYAAYLAARNREGYPVCRPQYCGFGVGWEAFGALGWKTNEKTVTDNVDHYLALGYPLEWMVLGSGFWPNEDPNLCATTSFGMWDKTRYPDPKGFIAHFKRQGLQFLLGLRIAFIQDGPYSAEGVAKGYFLKEAGQMKAWQLGFPKRPAYLLDGSNPEAVKWYAGLCQKWLDFGVDGFKEDLFGYGIAGAPDGNIDRVNQALVGQGIFVMGRNCYLGSACDLHRINDFNFNQNQDRGPLNVLALAYSGFPYAYPDIVGGTFGEGRRMPPLTNTVMQHYLMRAAQFDAVNPAMALGMGPWNFGSPQVEQVVLAATQLHARLHPYLYSAAMDTYETGFPSTLTPLPLAFPDDPQVYGRENSSVRGYEWLLGPSLLACPLYGDDYATAETRDVYLPAGKWEDYDTGEVFAGPKLLRHFSLPVGKTPLFVGGAGVLILHESGSNTLQAVVYPVATPGSTYRFTDRDGLTHSRISIANAGWDHVVVADTAQNQETHFAREPKTGAIRFALIPGHDYQIRSAPPEAKVGGARTVVVFGDSITAGGELPVSERSNLWLRVVEREAGGRLKMINEGKGGRPTASLGEFAAMLQRQPRPDLLVIALGGNDARNTNSDCVPKALANVRSMVAQARAAYDAKLPVLLVGPLNINRAALGPTKVIGQEREANLRQLNAAFAQLAGELECDFVSWFGLVPAANLIQDGVHPDSAGNAAIARVMLAKLQP